jgi:hypothetical protein
MAITAVQTVDIATALEQVLDGVDGLRAYRYVADNFRPPGAIVAMPSIDWADPESGFCSATWTFGISIIVGRNQDRAAQDLLSRLVSEAAQALNTADVEGVVSIEVLTAIPSTVSVSGQELPAYTVRVRVRA